MTTFPDTVPIAPPATEADPSPVRIIELGLAFGAAKVLFAAVEVDLFTTLSGSPAGEGALRDALGLHPRGLRQFLDALVELGLLDREDGLYRNTALAERYLVRGRPGYIGPFLGRANNVLYPAWGEFSEAVRCGTPSVERSRDTKMFHRLYQNFDQMRDFLSMMDALNELVGPMLAGYVDWSMYRSVVDVGGARGNLLAHLLRTHPHLQGTVFDLPEVEAAFEEYLPQLGVGDRMRFQGGDFFHDPLPEGDVLIFGHVLQDWSPERRRLLINKASQAVNEGGALLLYDPMLDGRGHAGSLLRLLASLTMLVMTAGGSEYTLEECSEWLHHAGFGAISTTPLGPIDTLIVAQRG